MFRIPDDLYSYQKEDVQKLLKPGNFLLFNEMGTGKTPESLATCELSGFRRVLIVCPNSLRWEWARQILDWTGEKAAVSLRSARKRLDPFFNNTTKYYVINYESFRISRYKEILVGLPWDCIILDEAHKLKSPRRLQSKGIYELCMRRKDKTKILALTGSPIINNPSDLHNLLCLTQSNLYTPGDRNLFIDRYCYYVPTRYGVKITGTRNLDELRSRTAPYTIRRTKKEVLPYLPDKYYRFPELQMDDEQRDLYQAMEEDLFVLLDEGLELTAPSVLAQLMRLRQLNLDPHILGSSVSSSKTDFLDDLVDSIVSMESDDVSEEKEINTSNGNGNGGQKLVIFSCFATYIRYLHHRYSNIPHVILTGEENAEDRAVSVKRFQEDPNIKICMGTIQAMGEGITLTAASNVVLMDRWWSPAQNSQAIDRLHRIGQRNPVQVIIPTNIDSIDQSLSTILRRKEEFAAGYFNDSSILAEVINERRKNPGKD